MDGSNASLERDGCFARTHSGAPAHASFDGLKALHATIKERIPPGVQLFGEWCYARHSIEYTELPNYFLLFNVRQIGGFNSVRDFQADWASWEEVEMWADDIGASTVPVLFKGICNTPKDLEELVNTLMVQPSKCGGIREGVVARVADSFDNDAFSVCVMKCVRANHVQTSDHWKNQVIIKNKLKI